MEGLKLGFYITLEVITGLSELQSWFCDFKIKLQITPKRPYPYTKYHDVAIQKNVIVKGFSHSGRSLVKEEIVGPTMRELVAC
jgi:hypothetical protein